MIRMKGIKVKCKTKQYTEDLKKEEIDFKKIAVGN